MSSIDIYTYNDTFISRNSCCQNYYKSPCLFVGDGIRGCCSTDINIAFMQFNLDSIDKCSTLENAMLYIYINCEYFSDCNLTFPLDIYKVLSCYNSCKVSWTTGPNIKCTRCGIIINRNSVNCYVGVDITPIVKEWLKNPCCNNGIALVGKCTKRVISIGSSKSCNEPFLRLNFCPCPYDNLDCCQYPSDNSMSCSCQYPNQRSNCSDHSCSCNEFTSCSCQYTNPCSNWGRDSCSCPINTCQYPKGCLNKCDCCKSCNNSSSNINDCYDPCRDCYSNKDSCYKPCIDECPCLPCNECPCPKPCSCECIYPRIINPCCPTNVICCTTPSGTTCCYSCSQCPCCGYCICSPTTYGVDVTGTNVNGGINVISEAKTSQNLMESVKEKPKAIGVKNPKVEESVVNINPETTEPITKPVEEDNVFLENINNTTNLESEEKNTLDHIIENLEERKESYEKSYSTEIDVLEEIQSIDNIASNSTLEIKCEYNNHNIKESVVNINSELTESVEEDTILLEKVDNITNLENKVENTLDYIVEALKEKKELYEKSYSIKMNADTDKLILSDDAEILLEEVQSIDNIVLNSDSEIPYEDNNSKIEEPVTNINTDITEPLKEDKILLEKVNDTTNLESKENRPLDYIIETLKEKKESYKKVYSTEMCENINDKEIILEDKLSSKESTKKTDVFKDIQSLDNIYLNSDLETKNELDVLDEIRGIEEQLHYNEKNTISINKYDTINGIIEIIGITGDIKTFVDSSPIDLIEPTITTDSLPKITEKPKDIRELEKQDKNKKSKDINETKKIELTKTGNLKLTDNIMVKEPIDVLGMTLDDFSPEIILITASSSPKEIINIRDNNTCIDNGINKNIKEESLQSANYSISIAQFGDESNFLNLYNNSLIPLKNIFIYGENIKHVDGSSEILLSTNHTYMVNWTISAMSTNPDFTMGGRLLLNDSRVIGSFALNSLNNLKEAYITTSSSLILNTTKEKNILQLKYITLSKEVDKIINVALHIIEIK